MVSRMNEFREFVSLHPLLRDEVKKGSKVRAVSLKVFLCYTRLIE